VRAELLSELPLVRAARYGDGPEAHARGELDAEMAEAADALDPTVSPSARAIAEGVVGRDAAQSSGAASAASRFSGMRAAASCGTITYSAYPPS